MIYKKELKAAINAAKKARKIILNIYNKKFDVEYKSDNSPVTAADKKSNLVIYNYIKKHFPNHSILSEELKDDKSRLKNEWCWIVDPLDGTKEFVKKNGEFSINIALTKNNKAVLGVILIPVTNELYFAIKHYGAFYKNKLFKRRIFTAGKINDLILLKSRSYKSDRLESLIDNNKIKIKEVKCVGSSIKGCLIAQGKADIYYRFGNTYEWDTAAMQIIVEEAGGIFRQLDDTIMTYNRENTLNEKGFYILNRIENKLV